MTCIPAGPHTNDPKRPAPYDAKPGIQPLVRVEKKGRGGKTVTVIERLGLSDDELKALLKKLQQACGTGGTVKDHRIEIQGHFVEKITKLLSALVPRK
jgi:translation initiation factor 1